MAGRPTVCTKALMATARAYPDNYNTEYGHSIPSLVGLCRVIKIGKTTAYRWCEENNVAFRDIVEKVNNYQEFDLVNNGITGIYNPTMAKLLLTKHGYHDKLDQQSSGALVINMTEKDAGTL